MNAYRFQYYFFYFHRMHTRDADVSSGLTPSSNIRLLLTCLIKSTVKYVLIVRLFGILKINIFMVKVRGLILDKTKVNNDLELM